MSKNIDVPSSLSFKHLYNVPGPALTGLMSQFTSLKVKASYFTSYLYSKDSTLQMNIAVRWSYT